MESTAARVSIILLVVSAMVIIVSAKLWGNSYENPIIQYITNVCIGVSTNIVGIIVTISVAQYFLDKQSIKDEKRNEYKKIIRYSKYARVLIYEYILYFNSVVTPMEKRNEISGNKFIQKFQLGDMCDLYRSTTFLKDRFYTPVIERFYSAEEELFMYLLRMNGEIDFKYSSNIGVSLNNFFVESKRLDIRNYILGQQQLVTGNEKNSEAIEKELKALSRDYIEDYKEGKLGSHMMTPVVQLFFI